MKIFDTHCHLDDPSFNLDLDMVIEKAHKAGVASMMVVGIDTESSKKAVAISRKHDSIYSSVGVHPHDARFCSEDILKLLKELALDRSVKAWGETGLDFNRMYSPRKDQEHWFTRQLEIGAELNLPMIFHERDSQGRFLSLIKHCWGSPRQGVVHCFSGTSAELNAYLELDLHIGITGILTIKSRGQALREMVHRIPEHLLLIETDAPYLTPAPERNKIKRNEPAFVRTVLFKLAEILGRDPVMLARTLWQNSNRFFNIT